MGKSSKLLAVVFFTLAAANFAYAEFELTVIQTADIHSHFTDRDSEFGLGGVARVATKAQELRSQYRNTLFLDAGDYSEGSIFFTLDSGETSDRVMETLGYDAIVLGNHDWLIGPEQLYASLSAKQFQIPILSANINTKSLPPGIELKKFIRPYLIKQFGNVKVGILGLSTFQLIFDSFFKPVKILEPTLMAKYYVEILKKVEGCDIVIVLSHLGIAQDTLIANYVSGVDLIVGGHNHLLFRTPTVVNNVPITHVGKWGQYVGEIHLVMNHGKTKLTDYKVHQIDSSIPEDPYVKSLVDNALQSVQQKFARYPNLFDDKIFHSDVDLPIHQDNVYEDIAGNWAADALREVTQADIVIDNPTYAPRDLFRGDSSTVDFFNSFPHVYNPMTGSTWTVKKISLSGFTMKWLVTFFYRLGFNLRLSGMNIVLDVSKSLNQVSSVTVDGRPISLLSSYSVGATDGIIAALDFLKSWGAPINYGVPEDTHLQAWEVIRDYFRSLSPITRDKVVWEGRVRTVQPDLMIRPEEFFPTKLSDANTHAISFVVRNNGMRPSPATLAHVNYTPEIDNTLVEKSDSMIFDDVIRIPALAPGEAHEVNLIWRHPGLAPGRYPVELKVTAVQGELELRNNVLETYVKVD